MKIKVSETTPIQLDWLVAKCLNAHGDWKYPEHFAECHRMGVFNHSTDPAQGQPILEQEGGTLWSTNACGWRCKGRYDHINDHEGPTMTGPTMLIAGLRCFVASRMGDEVEVPEELS